MSENWSFWHESIERDDPAPSYITITLSTGRMLKICQEDLIDQIEKGTIEAMTTGTESDLVNKYPVDLSRRLTVADRRFLRAVGIADMEQI